MLYLFMIFAAFLLLGLAGIFGNCFILSAQWRVPELRNIFVAALACTDLLVCSYFSVSSFTVITDSPNITQTECFIRCAPNLFPMTGSNLMCLVLGFDRLAAIVYPLAYKKTPAAVRRGTALVCTCVLPTCMLCLAGWAASPATMGVFCNLPSSLGPPAFQVFMGGSLATNVTVIAVYVLVALKMKLSSNSKIPGGAGGGQLRQKVEDRNATITKSLIVVACMQISTWFLTASVSLTLQAAGASPELTEDVMLPLGVAIVLNHGCNGYIYAWRSREYRNAFRALFLTGLRKQVSLVTPLNVTVQERKQSQTQCSTQL